MTARGLSLIAFLTSVPSSIYFLGNTWRNKYKAIVGVEAIALPTLSTTGYIMFTEKVFWREDKPSSTSSWLKIAMT